MRKQDGTLISIHSPQGRRVVGRLVKEVLHIDRDYKVHHLHKFKGWAMAIEVFEQHPSIRGIRINAKNAPKADGSEGERIYLFSFDDANLEPSDMETKDFGHGKQIFIPDSLWEVLDSNGFLRTDKPVTPTASAKEEILGGPPTLDDLETEKASQDEMDFGDDFSVLFYPEEKEQTKSHTDIKTSNSTPSRFFDVDTAMTLLEAGYTIHLVKMQHGLKLWREGKHYFISIPGNELCIPVDIVAFYEMMKSHQHTLDF